MLYYIFFILLIYILFQPKNKNLKLKNYNFNLLTKIDDVFKYIIS